MTQDVSFVNAVVAGLSAIFGALVAFAVANRTAKRAASTAHLAELRREAREELKPFLSGFRRLLDTLDPEHWPTPSTAGSAEAIQSYVARCSALHSRIKARARFVGSLSYFAILARYADVTRDTVLNTHGRLDELENKFDELPALLSRAELSVDAVEVWHRELTTLQTNAISAVLTLYELTWQLPDIAQRSLPQPR